MEEKVTATIRNENDEREEVEVIVEGIYDEANKKFVANSLLAKCPSRYDGMDVEEHNKAMAEINADI